jgi:hypothetical protein
MVSRLYGQLTQSDRIESSVRQLPGVKHSGTRIPLNIRGTLFQETVSK